MPEAPRNEFWRTIKPIANVFRTGALPEVYLSKVAEGDERYCAVQRDCVVEAVVDLAPAKHVGRCADGKGGWLSESALPPASSVRVRDFGQVGYLEHEWTATAGDFIYEPPGESHTLVAYDSGEPMGVFFVVQGPLIGLDENGNGVSQYDVFDYIAAAREHYEKVGIVGGIWSRC